MEGRVLSFQANHSCLNVFVFGFEIYSLLFNIEIILA